MNVSKASYAFIITLLFAYYLYYLWIPSEINCINVPNISYTYIIVGAGTAGCVLAARLSEKSHNKVLLIEAGGHFNALAKIPPLAVFLQRSNYDWKYETEPQKWSSLGFYNKIQRLPRGKGLGGSNQINLLIHNGLDSDSECELQHSLLSYVRSKKCSKRCHLSKHIFSLDAQKCEYFPFRVQRSTSELGDVLEESLKELNRPALKYYKGDSSIHKGERWCTFRSHLLPAANRDNLHVLCDTEVKRVLFKGKRAIGVQLSDDREIYAKTEIIISAGSINSPKLLLMSGIGDKVHLRELNVTTIQNLPGVGQNLHDHVSIPIYVEIKTALSLTLRKVINPIEVFNYALKRKGVFGTSPVAAFLRSSEHFLILFTGSTPEYPFRSVSNYLPETFRNLLPYAGAYDHEGLVFLAGCKMTRSRGFVKLNVDKSVIVDPQYLREEQDVERVKNAMTLALEILNTTSFNRIGAKAHLPSLSQCLSRNLTEDAYLKCVVRVAAITTYHQAGTCKMGNDALSVVDNNFRVRGVTGLRIVDGSVLPTPSNNFPNTAITIMAEYASSLLLFHG